MPLIIDYTSEGFPAGSPVTNGGAVLTTNWNELLWAAVTVGRPNRQYVFRHGNASMYEALFRLSLVRMALEQSGPSAYRLRRTDAAKTLDPSEKGAVNYFIGMVFCKLFSWKLLNAPWAIHLDAFRPQLNRFLTGRSRPDLVAETASGEWLSLEAKGRISAPSNEAKNKAKQQAERLVSVNGAPIQFHIGCITYLRNDTIRFFWRDPEPPQDKPHRQIKLELNDNIWRYYYRPMLDLIMSRPQSFDAMLHETVLMPIKELDIEIGIHPEVLKPLSHDQWIYAKRSYRPAAEYFRKEGYQPDGVRIVAGPTWLLPFAENNT